MDTTTVPSSVPTKTTSTIFTNGKRKIKIETTRNNAPGKVYSLVLTIFTSVN